MEYTEYAARLPRTDSVTHNPLSISQLTSCFIVSRVAGRFYRYTCCPANLLIISLLANWLISNKNFSK
jgi:hypothetical protein